jgi:signal transduction histidine kinase
MIVRESGVAPGRLLPLVQLTLLVSAAIFCPHAHAEPINNLRQLARALGASQKVTGAVDIQATVCAVSRPTVGVLIVQDETGVELLQLGGFEREILPGERIRIQGSACLLRKREMGVEISAGPTIDVDGLHARRRGTAEMTMKAGRTPLRVEWFNSRGTFELEILIAELGQPPRAVAASALWHTVVNEAGESRLEPGLLAQGYEGAWQNLPDFNLLQPLRTGVETNFGLATRSRDELVGIRYSGQIQIPHDGEYRIVVSSDDGAMLFLGQPDVTVANQGHTNVPTARPTGLLAAGFSSLDERRFVEVEGRVSFVTRFGEGARFEIGTDRQVIPVRLADAAGLDLSDLLNARVKVTGIGCAALTADQTPVLGKLFAASAKDIVLVESGLVKGDPPLPIRSAAIAQSLTIEQARRSLPVRLRGVVTSAITTSQDRWMSFQDDTRGIFVRLPAFSSDLPGFGEMWEVEGRSGAGNFAPIVVAERMTRLGDGLLPAPVKPTWTELLNGSKDVQWAEVKGLVAGVRSNTISLYLPEGRLDVELEGRFESELRPFLKAVVRIRGVLYAVWEAATREVRIGEVLMRNSAISMDIPAPTDPFDAVSRTPRELLLFDAQASAFRPVKVRGQIVYADPTQLFLQEGGTGLRLLPVEETSLRPGDVVEAVGYPDIGSAQLRLREVLLRKTGEAPLSEPAKLDESALLEEDLNSTRVLAEGKMLGWHVEAKATVLEMQSGDRLFLARIPKVELDPPSMRVGSRLAMVGVLLAAGGSRSPSIAKESFELLVNSMADISVLSQPPWWTLPRLLAVVGMLLVILIFTMIWITQLRRLVEQRTHQLQHETRERERIERRHALEAERSRIARDLHDDLGSSLTEISVLASTGQLPQSTEVSQPGLFQAIGAKARSLISALDVIVWAVDPEDNSLQSLADYLSGYTSEFFSHTSIACRLRVPVSFPPITLEGRVRHDLLMAVKEALNNIVRHADATEVELRMAMADHSLEIDILDNGKGIREVRRDGGHGLKNLAARLEKIGGSCVVQPRADRGTIVRIRLPFAAGTNAALEAP